MDNANQLIHEEIGTAVENAKDEILDAINKFASDTEQRFQSVESRLDKVEDRFDRVDSRLDKVDNRLDRIESSMVTQSIFGQRIDSVEDRLLDIMRHADKKTTTLVQILHKKNVLSDDDVRELLGMPPFVKQGA